MSDGLEHSPWSANYQFKTLDEEPPNRGDTDLSRITYYENFENLPVGGSVEDHTELTVASSGRIVTTDPYAGSRCMETTIDRGAEGYGDWGFSCNDPFPDVYEGGKIWVRAALKYPADYSFYTETGRLKFFRLGKHEPRQAGQSEGNNNGYIDFYIQSGGDHRIEHTVEYSWKDTFPEYSGWIVNDNAHIKPGQWQMWEFYVKLGSQGEPHGGGAEWRCWVDGQLTMYYNDRRTMSGPPRDGYTRRWLLHTYWNDSGNGGAPKTQSSWIDEVAVAIEGGSSGRNDEQYLAVDDQGNRFIGMAKNG